MIGITHFSSVFEEFQLNCRHCNSALCLPFVDLGSAPPSNAYLAERDLQAVERWFPLKVQVCENCWLVQTEDYADRDLLFNQNYAYFSSFSTSWLQHSEAYVEKLVDLLELGRDSMVVDVAANDGYLLQYVKARHIPCYGVEPTSSTADAARAKGIDIVERFFGQKLAAELVAEGRQADLTAANNVLAHVPDINDFVAGFATLLKPAGVATFEFPHLLSLVTDNQFDTIYHEHYSYLSLIAVDRIFCENGLMVWDVEQIETHGGSLRVYAQRLNAQRPVSPRVAAMLDNERAAGIATADFYRSFQSNAEQIKDDLLAFLIQAKRAGKRVAAYGAAAKGNTLCNFAGVRPDLLPYVVDRNPSKSGNYMPGSRIPIVDEDRLRSDRPDYIVILPWNLRNEIVQQLSYVRDHGGQFVVAVPKLELI